jgi:cytochrome b involved in lipid metabolism
VHQHQAAAAGAGPNVSKIVKMRPRQIQRRHRRKTLQVTDLQLLNMTQRTGSKSTDANPEPLRHHTPFPNRKYGFACLLHRQRNPSATRSHLIDDPILWLEDKAKVDHVADGLWRIHGKAYDFSSFAVKHPGNARADSFVAMCPASACFGSVASSGGKHWIELTKGLDITDLFEVHHLNLDKASAILPKYYVKVRAVASRLNTSRAL